MNAELGLTTDSEKSDLLFFLREKLRDISSFNNIVEGVTERASVAAQIHSMQLQNWYLVYVGPTNSSISSLFGHIFLVRENENFFDSDAYAYMAQIDSNDSVGSLIFNGVGGYYSGRLSREKLYKALRRYSELENRSVYFFKIDGSVVNLSGFSHQLEEQEGISTSYRFLSNNCTSFFRKLLARNSTNQILEEKSVDYPLELVRELAEKKVVSLDRYWPSSYLESLEQYDNLTSKQKGEVQGCLKNLKDTSASCQNLDAQERSFFSAYYSLQVNLFQKIDFLNRISEVSDFSTLESLKKAEMNPVPWSTAGPSLLEISYGQKSVSTFVRYRPTLQDAYNFSNTSYYFDELAIANTELEFGNQAGRVSHFQLLNMGAYREFDWVHKDLSYRLSLLDYKNLFEEGSVRHTDNSFDLGISKVGKNWRFTSLLSPTISLGDSVTSFLALDFIFEMRFAKRIKLLAEADIVPYKRSTGLKRVLDLSLLGQITDSFGIKISSRSTENQDDIEYRNEFVGLEYFF